MFYEFQVKKLDVVGKVAEKDMVQLESHLQELTQAIRLQNEQLSTLAYELEREKQFKKFRQEYDGLAGTILQLPDRQSQMERAKKLQQELDLLNRENERLCANLDLRNKQFALLMRTVASLQSTLDAEDELISQEDTRKEIREELMVVDQQDERKESTGDEIVVEEDNNNNNNKDEDDEDDDDEGDRRERKSQTPQPVEQETKSNVMDET